MVVREVRWPDALAQSVMDLLAIESVSMLTSGVEDYGSDWQTTEHWKEGPNAGCSGNLIVSTWVLGDRHQHPRNDPAGGVQDLAPHLAALVAEVNSLPGDGESVLDGSRDRLNVTCWDHASREEVTAAAAALVHVGK